MDLTIDTIQDVSSNFDFHIDTKLLVHVREHVTLDSKLRQFSHALYAQRFLGPYDKDSQVNDIREAAAIGELWEYAKEDQSLFYDIFKKMKKFYDSKIAPHYRV